MRRFAEAGVFRKASRPPAEEKAARDKIRAERSSGKRKDAELGEFAQSQEPRDFQFYLSAGSCLPRRYVCGVAPSMVRNISMKALTLS